MRGGIAGLFRTQCRSTIANSFASSALCPHALPRTKLFTAKISTIGHLTYSIPPSDGSRAFQRMEFDDTFGGRERNWTPDVRKVVIEDVRGNEDKYTLDIAGFQFYHRPSKHTKFQDEEKIKAEYYPECMELIKELTGATKVIPFSHFVRRRRPGGINDNPKIRQPSSFVHVDQTTAYAIAQLHDHLPNEAPALLLNRFQLINLWRPISHPAVDWPLTLCDYRSLDMDGGLTEVTLIFNSCDVEALHVKYDPNHRWVYKSAMDPEDFVLLKCVDTTPDSSIARMAPHTAFEDPNTPEGTPFRESIELRVFVFYEKD